VHSQAPQERHTSRSFDWRFAPSYRCSYGAWLATWPWCYKHLTPTEAVSRDYGVTSHDCPVKSESSSFHFWLWRRYRPRVVLRRWTFAKGYVALGTNKGRVFFLLIDLEI